MLIMSLHKRLRLCMTVNTQWTIRAISGRLGRRSSIETRLRSQLVQ